MFSFAAYADSDVTVFSLPAAVIGESHCEGISNIQQSSTYASTILKSRALVGGW